MCKLHRAVADRQEQIRRMTLLWAAVMDTLWGPQVIEDVNQLTPIVDHALEQGWILQVYYDHLIREIQHEWGFYTRERLLPTSKARTDLQRIAMDKQNVHTREVTKMLSDSMKFLLETPIPAGQETIAELETAWSGKSASQRKNVLKDVNAWYGKRECIQENDWLYKKMLDGLWVRVKAHKERDELTKRLWEEALDSVSKCCQGHLSRLANVMVGFTEEVKAEVPVGELLQQKIAAIAAKEIGVEYKVCEAWVVFEELKIPMEERDAWIEAF